MLRDNLAGLIEPMVDRAGAHPLGGHHKAGQIGGCSRSNELPSVALKRSWRQLFRWKTGRPAEKAKWSALKVTTAADDSPAVGTAQHPESSDDRPPMPQTIPAPKGRNLCTNGERRSPFHAEPRQYRRPARRMTITTRRGSHPGISSISPWDMTIFSTATGTSGVCA